MTKNEKVQIRQHDGGEHWIFAVAIDPDNNRYQVNHPGNADHEKQLTVDSTDVRTKADVEALLEAAKKIPAGKPLSDADIDKLGKADGWLLHFKRAEHSQSRVRLHKLLVDHYEAQLKRLA
jgi:hypothetical protein